MEIMEKAGIFGGTFDPIHLGHLIIAQHFVEYLELDNCFFVPTNVSPFKADNNKEDDEIHACHRLEMIKLAIRGNEKFEVDDFEVKRKGISYSIDTIHHFLTKYNYTKFFFLIGSDQVSKFDEWKDYKEILKNVRLCIALRPGQDLNASFEKNIQKLTINNDEKPYIIKSPLIDISSTKIRDRIANGLSVRYLVPESVSGYINQHNLYQK